eukprot:TRINITY_DN31435_c0_g1_i2.p1 TRINITY_DN31435_c0_g1~~TRINITY_DN31435_c0_g1_i2.p1  ORF type:complete len:476 (-),score=116.03 TRINITY_DN31435_c0_g1_i2:76-1323(-)
MAKIENFSVESLASVSWAFAALRLRHGRLMHAIAQEAAPKIKDFDEEDLAKLAWSFATMDLAPPELTRLLVEEASTRAFEGRNHDVTDDEDVTVMQEASTHAEDVTTGDDSAAPEGTDARRIQRKKRNRPQKDRQSKAQSLSSDQQRPTEKADDVPFYFPGPDSVEYPSVHESLEREGKLLSLPRKAPPQRKQKDQTEEQQQVSQQSQHNEDVIEENHEKDSGEEDCSEALEEMDEEAQEADDGPRYDALLNALREQLRATHGERLVGKLSDTQVLTKTSADDIDCLEGGTSRRRSDLSKEDQARILDLMEASRLAEKAGRHRTRSLAKKKERAEKKLDRDYLKNEMKKAFNAQHNQFVRYYNSVAIRVHKGEKAVDVKTIEQVTAAQGVKHEERPRKERSAMTKEERVMARRVA